MMSALPHRLKTISELHRLRGFPKPAHPLLSVIDLSTITHLPATEITSLTADFYLIALKRDFHAQAKTTYGQQTYDHAHGAADRKEIWLQQS